MASISNTMYADLPTKFGDRRSRGVGTQTNTQTLNFSEMEYPKGSNHNFTMFF